MNAARHVILPDAAFAGDEHFGTAAAGTVGELHQCRHRRAGDNHPGRSDLIDDRRDTARNERVHRKRQTFIRNSRMMTKALGGGSAGTEAYKYTRGSRASAVISRSNPASMHSGVSDLVCAAVQKTRMRRQAVRGTHMNDPWDSPQ